MYDLDNFIYMYPDINKDKLFFIQTNVRYNSNFEKISLL